MNNGLYVGPIISRNSPRWRMQEFYAQLTATTASGGVPCITLFEPYIPPAVSAVMITATAGNRITGNQMAGAASCHNIVVPLRSRRLFIEVGQNVRITLISDADLTQLTAAQLPSNNAEFHLQLNSGPSGANASVQMRAAFPLNISATQSAPFYNGVLYGGNAAAATFSLADPRLRPSGTSLQASPGNLFAPARSQTSLDVMTSGSGNATVTAGMSGGYVRLEYLL